MEDFADAMPRKLGGDTEIFLRGDLPYSVANRLERDAGAANTNTVYKGFIDCLDETATLGILHLNINISHVVEAMTTYNVTN